MQFYSVDTPWMATSASPSVSGDRGERPEGFVFTLTTVAFLIIHCWALPLRKALSPGAVLVGFSFMSDERVSGSQFILQVGVSLSDFLETATKHRAPW